MRSRVALGTLFAATTASLTVTITGLAGLSGVPGTDRFTPTASAAELLPFGSCEELLEWYVDQALPEVGPYGLGGWPMAMPIASTEAELRTQAGGAPEMTEAPVADTSAPVESSGTGTNVQESGVDEPDRAKTDGRHVVHVRGHQLVVTDVTGATAREVGRLTLPRQLAEAELLLAGDTVLVLGPEQQHGGWGAPMPTDIMTSRIMAYPVPTVERSQVLEVSISDPAAPRLVSQQSFGGGLVSARQHDDTVRLVLGTGQPVIDFVQPNRELTRREATEENQQRLRESSIEDWLPTVATGDGPAEPLVDCADVRHPATGDGYGTVTVVTLDAADPTALDTLGVTTSGRTVYSSTDRLYLATWADKSSTDVHAFALGGSTTSYSASGNVAGVLADRWSMDEHGGMLRLALGHGPGWSPNENGITTLRQVGDRLEVVGSLRGLGPNEEIKAVRWFDDLAIVVTFRQVDPLYTVDLSDPRSPRALGELKIPGFSEYLHPIGDDQLLGLGQHATNQGRILGGQASLFDVGELTDPQRLDTLALGRHAYPMASQDPRTFTWLADRRLALAVVEDQWNGSASIVEIAVDGGSLSDGNRWPLPRWHATQGRTLPLPDGSVAVVSTTVELIDVDRPQAG